MEQLYIHTELIHNMTAPREVVPIVLKFISPASVLDVGCGTGTWLKAFEEKGVKDYLGVDGDYVDQSMLKISPEKFKPLDLTKRFDLNRKFDLVVSLEVAEHLATEQAEIIVDSLIKHGDVILFSAAIPGQGGQNHLNEQWPEYWQEKFASRGFYFHDVIRPEIWNNSRVDFWYKQNIFLLKKEKPDHAPFRSPSVVHPDLYKMKLTLEEYQKSLLAGKQGLKISWTIFFNAIKFKLKSLLKGK